MSTAFPTNGPARAADIWTLGTIAFRGIGQVMFQGHAGTGLLFLAGIAVASPLMAVGAALGAIIGPAVARLLRFDLEEIKEGIYGFNPTLVGVALMFYLRPVALTWVLVVAGCALASLVTFLMRRFLKFPTYTAPFIVCTWVLLLVAHGIAGTAIDLKPAPPLHTPQGLFEVVLAGAAEVMFGANIVTGALFLVGIALSNWRHSLLALLGSVVGTASAYYHNDPQGTISIGIYGYNSALAAMAVYVLRPSLNLPILAAILAVPLTEIFPKTLGIPPLTAPFVAATWVVLAIGALEPYFCRE
jgi:urea transporter